jgi:hypothetical protein
VDKKLSVVVPYRNRQKHLERYIPFIKEYLKNIPNRIFIIEQKDDKAFNRGKLLNIGYKVSKVCFDYVCFHDIDLLPENADYSYVETVRQLSVYVEQFDYNTRWDLGGVIVINKDIFEKVNGYSNEYWDWGAEDSDLKFRIEQENIPIYRDSNGGRFNSLSHSPNGDNKPGGLSDLSRKNRNRYRYLIEHSVYDNGVYTCQDGLNTLQYKVVEYCNGKDYVYYGVKL